MLPVSRSVQKQNPMATFPNEGGNDLLVFRDLFYERKLTFRGIISSTNLKLKLKGLGSQGSFSYTKLEPKRFSPNKPGNKPDWVKIADVQSRVFFFSLLIFSFFHLSKIL